MKYFNSGIPVRCQVGANRRESSCVQADMQVLFSYFIIEQIRIKEDLIIMVSWQ